MESVHEHTQTAKADSRRQRFEICAMVSLAGGMDRLRSTAVERVRAQTRIGQNIRSRSQRPLGTYIEMQSVHDFVRVRFEHLPRVVVLDVRHFPVLRMPQVREPGCGDGCERRRFGDLCKSGTRTDGRHYCKERALLVC